MAKIVGRFKEQERLRELYMDERPEFVVVYGRRRVGKTFLVREMFKKEFAFYHTAQAPYDENGEKTTIVQQLQSFQSSLVRYGETNPLAPKNWLEAFDRLIALLERNSQRGKRQVVFLDELPWMDTAKSAFLPAFEHFWNGWGSGRDNLMLIVCGSATTWIFDKLINGTGGLYNRTTAEIRLSPFTLVESSDFYTDRRLEISLYDQLEYYMILGGIPYYMNYIERGKSLSANVDTLFFNRGSKLQSEFDRLFSSLFKRPEGYKKIIRFLAKARTGYTRDEISKGTGIGSGGGLSCMLDALEASDFITHYTPFASFGKISRYKLSDCFLLFYLTFADGVGAKSEGYWERFESRQKLSAWKGLAFESVCFNHIPQIKNALGINGVYTEEYSWIRDGNNSTKGVQVDMIIDRDDRIINLCEMKFFSGEYSVSAEEEEKIRMRKAAVSEAVHQRKSVHPILITNNNIKTNAHSVIFQKVITAKDLMK